MSYTRYLTYDIFGGILWAGSMILGGYYLGRLVGPEVLSRRIHWVIAVVVFLSLLPAIIGALRVRGRQPRKPVTTLSADAEPGQD